MVSKRKFRILDLTNNITLEIEVDVNAEYLEIWGMDHEKEPVVILEKKIYTKTYNKPPFAILNKKQYGI